MIYNDTNKRRPRLSTVIKALATNLLRTSKVIRWSSVKHESITVRAAETSIIRIRIFPQQLLRLTSRNASHCDVQNKIFIHICHQSKFLQRKRPSRILNGKVDSVVRGVTLSAADTEDRGR